MTMLNNAGDWDSRRSSNDEFEAALKTGKDSDWYDDALFHYAEWMNTYGTLRQLEDGQWLQEPNLRQGNEMYRRLLREFRKGETRYSIKTQQQIKTLQTRPQYRVSNVFLPGSGTSVALNAAI